MTLLKTEKWEHLLFRLIFSDETEFIIDISEYSPQIYRYEIFVKEVKDILRKSKVVIVSSSLDVESETVTWKLKVKR